MAPRPRAVRHSLLVAAGFTAIAVVCTWPISREATRSLPGDAGDPLLIAWAIGWIADRLRHGFVGLWTAPSFFPYANTLAFSEHFLGFAPAVAPIVWATGNPLLAYNVAFVASFALAGIGMYVLVIDLIGRRSVAWVAGLAFALAPARFAQIGHLQVLMSGWMPLALWALHRYLRTSEWRWLAAFTAFVLVESLSNSYFAYFIALPIVIVAGQGLVAAGARRRQLLVGLACSAAVIVLVMAPIGALYFGVQREFGFRRSIEDVVNFGADLGSYLRGNDGVPHIIEPWRHLPNVVKPIGPEGQLFPGIAVFVLAIIGAAAAWWRRAIGLRDARVYTGVLLAAVWLSMGPYPTAWRIHLPIGGAYGLLFRYLPGFDGIRVPARLSIVALIAFDVLAAFGLASVQRRVAPPLGGAVTAAAIVLVVLEGIAVPTPTVFIAARGRPSPTADAWVRDQESGAVLDVPVAIVSRPTDPFRFQYQSLFHRHRIVGGASGWDSPLDGFVGGPASPLFDPAQFADALRMLRAVGVGTIVVHPDAFTDRDAEILAMTELRAAHDQVARETPVAGEVIFSMKPVSDAERNGWPGSRTAAGRLRTATRPVPTPALAADSPIGRERLPYVFDGDLDSRWIAGTAQTGGERLDVVLDRPRDIAMLRIETSPRSVGNYPRHLVVEGVDDDGRATVLFDGSVLRALGEGLIADPVREPIDLWLPRNSTRRLGLRQTAQRRTWFWAVDELKLLEAVPTPSQP